MTLLITLLITFAVNNINYSIIDDEAIVAKNPGIKGDLTIPTTVKYQGNTYFVTGIADSAFYDCYELTSIKLPKNIDHIGSFAFFNTSIKEPVFSKTVFGYLPFEYSGEYVIPKGITEIAGGAFCACGDLTSVIIPESVKTIGGNAFLATGITKPVMTSTHFAFLPTEYKGRFVIPDGITTIIDGAFFDCEDLTRVEIPNSVTSIGASAFSQCFKLDSVVIPSSVTAIEHNTFEWCKSLIYIALPPRLDHIGDNAFNECRWLSRIDLSHTQITHIGNRAFYNCIALQKITLLEGLLSLGNEAFAQCNDLAEANIPSSLVSCGIRPFAHTKIATPLFSKTLFILLPESTTGTYTIPDGITTIIPRACSFCQRLDAVVLPSTITEIGELAFQYSSLRTINIPQGVKVADNAFTGCRYLTK